MDLREASAAEAPSRCELNQLRTGMFVRLSIQSGECFWTMIEAAQRENRTYRGIAQTKPGSCSTVEQGDAVVFERRHVLEVV